MHTSLSHILVFDLYRSLVFNLTQRVQACLQGNLLQNLDSLNLRSLGQLAALRTLQLQQIDRSQPNPVCRLKAYKAGVLKELPLLANLDGER